MVKTREGGVEVVKIGGAVCLDQNQGVFTRLEFVDIWFWFWLLQNNMLMLLMYDSVHVLS